MSWSTCACSTGIMNHESRIRGLKDIERVFPKITKDDWLTIDGIGEKMAQAILDYFCDGRRLLTMQELPTTAFVNTLSFVILIMILNSVYFALLTLNGKSTK